MRPFSRAYCQMDMAEAIQYQLRKAGIPSEIVEVEGHFIVRSI